MKCELLYGRKWGAKFIAMTAITLCPMSSFAVDKVEVDLIREQVTTAGERVADLTREQNKLQAKIDQIKKELPELKADKAHVCNFTVISADCTSDLDPILKSSSLTLSTVGSPKAIKIYELIGQDLEKAQNCADELKSCKYVERHALAKDHEKKLQDLKAELVAARQESRDLSSQLRKAIAACTDCRGSSGSSEDAMAKAMMGTAAINAFGGLSSNLIGLGLGIHAMNQYGSNYNSYLNTCTQAGVPCLSPMGMGGMGMGGMGMGGFGMGGFGMPMGMGGFGMGGFGMPMGMGGFGMGGFGMPMGMGGFGMGGFGMPMGMGGFGMGGFGMGGFGMPMGAGFGLSLGGGFGMPMGMGGFGMGGFGMPMGGGFGMPMGGGFGMPMGGGFGMPMGGGFGMPMGGGFGMPMGGGFGMPMGGGFGMPMGGGFGMPMGGGFGGVGMNPALAGLNNQANMAYAMENAQNSMIAQQAISNDIYRYNLIQSGALIGGGGFGGGFGMPMGGGYGMPMGGGIPFGGFGISSGFAGGGYGMPFGGFGISGGGFRSGNGMF